MVAAASAPARARLIIRGEGTIADTLDPAQACKEGVSAEVPEAVVAGAAIACLNLVPDLDAHHLGASRRENFGAPAGNS